MKYDFDQIRRDNPLPDAVASSGLTLEKSGNEWKCPCPFHSEATASFTLYPRKGDGSWAFHCFGCGMHGDVIDYVRERYGYADNGEAARFLVGEDPQRTPVATERYVEAHDPYAGYEIGKPPAGAPEILPGVRSAPLLNPKRIDDKTGKAKLVSYTPKAVYAYRNKLGNLVGYVLRVEFDGKKVTPGIWWTKNEPKGFEGWAHGSYPSPRPLYGLDALHANPEHQVLLVEGEKCKDAAAEYMVGKRVTPVSWMGGGKAIEKTYWKSLAGRSIIIWPDNDPEGWKTTLGFARPGGSWKKGLIELLLDAGVGRIKVMHIEPTSRADKWDIADALAEGMTLAEVEALMRSTLVEWTAESFREWKASQVEREMPSGREDREADGVKEGTERVGGREERDTPEIPPTREEDRGYMGGDTRNGDGTDERTEVGPGFEKRKVKQDDNTVHRPTDAEGPTHQGKAERDDGEGFGRKPQADGADSRGAPSGAGESSGSAEPDREENLRAQDGSREIGPGFKIAPDNWRQHLIMKADGDGLKSNSLQNFTLILQYEKRFVGVYAWNSFASEVYLLRRPPWDVHGVFKPRKLNEPDITATTSWMEYCGMSPKVSDIGRVIVRVADHNRYNPVVDEISRLQWDGVKRVDTWLSYYLGADATDANRLFGRRWLIGAIARAKQPGCKMDNMLILEGPQGLKKSTALRTLSDGLTPGVFTDEMSDPNSKDAAMQMQGAWIIEISEMDSFKRAEISQIKAWVSRQIDRMRRPYGKVVEEFPRSCVFAGTVNPVGNSGYLKDPTGGRRFWPVLCREIDLETLKADARQLWAEAATIHATGERWWLTAEEEAIAFNVQAERYEDDPWSELIDNSLRLHTETTTNTIMEMLDIPKERRNTMSARRIEAHLSTRGWTKEKRHGEVVFVKDKGQVLV